MSKLAIGVFCTFINERYSSQVKGCYETWEADANEYQIPVVYYGDIDKGTFTGKSNIIYDVEVGTDQNSSFDKHFKCLKYMYDNIPSEYYLIVGSDVYINIKNLRNVLDKYDHNEPVYIGGHGYYRYVKDKNIYYHSGGSGYILSRNALSQIIPYFEGIKSHWHSVADDYLKQVCDVALGYLVTLPGINIRTCVEEYFYGCTDRGIMSGSQCCMIKNPYKIVICHYMEYQDIHRLHNEIKYPEVDRLYNQVETTRSDINEHIRTLYHYSKKCSTVAECGVRSCVSTWAFVKGLRDNNSTRKKLIGVDINYCERIEKVSSVCKSNDINYIFIMGDDIKVDLCNVDLLFIDTWHVYAHLIRELNKHHHNVRMYIILHDTYIDGKKGETIRNGWNAKHQSQLTGYPIDDINRGLDDAINEFVKNNNMWVIHKVYTNNNGLTILKRKHF